MQFGLFDWVEASDSLSPQEVYEHKLQMAAAADKAGLHGLFLAEHQGTPLSIDASPAVLLSAIFQRTQRLRAGALTFCLPWYDPYRFYNEVCMLDQMSGGRLELGVGRGVSPIESQIFGLKSIEESRERYRETLDIFFAACNSPLLSFSGKRYEFRDVELYNKPVQRPYPPLWFPSSNRDSIEFTARHGYHTALIAKTQHIVIAESYVEAERIGLQAYESWKGHMHHLSRRYDRPEALKLEPFGDESVQRLVVGPPNTVVEKLQEAIDATGMNYMLCIFSFGNLPPQAAQRSLEMFAKEVMPRLGATGGPASR